jgi:disulfide bond formation protein DsbB
MFIKTVNQLKNVAHGQWYWLVCMTAGLALLATALFYQYVLDSQPCVMCIHVRLWISLLVIVAFAGWLSRDNRVINTVTHISIALIAIGLTERSYQLLGTERGFVFSDCGFNLGLPSWFAIDNWLPWLYRVETTCGYTPKLLFNITMAEALMLMSACLLLTSVCVTLASFVRTRN